VAFLPENGGDAVARFDHDKIADYWENLPGTSSEPADKSNETYQVFTDFLHDVVENGTSPLESEYYRELADYFGWSDEYFDWDDFREWYDEQ
jgi:hypothetical protein